MRTDGVGKIAMILKKIPGFLRCDPAIMVIQKIGDTVMSHNSGS